MDPDKEELRQRLSPEEYAVTQKAGTEPAFTGRYWDHHESGVYACVVCGEPLFRSDEKYDSGSGWPSFWQPAEGANIEEKRDVSHMMVRTEVRCGKCQAHLGHLFDDGPEPTGQRYCINSAALKFRNAKGAGP